MTTFQQQQHGQLRDTLEQLQAYTLPSKFSDTGTTAAAAAALSDDIVNRYQHARNSYLQKRMQEVFYEHLASFDGQDFAFPNIPTEEEKQLLRERRLRAQQALKETAVQVNQQFLELKYSYEALVDQRQDLVKRVQDMEESVFEPNDNFQDSEEEEDTLEEGQLAAQEQRLATLRHRRAELEAELAQIRTETEQKQHLLTKQQHPQRVLSPTTVAELEQDNTKIVELREMTDWYDTMRGVLEELSGIKIITVDAAEEQVTILNVMLLESYQVMIGLKSDGRDALLVTTAQFSSSVQVSVDDSLELTVPALDDLVQICSTLGPVEDLRFLLRETMARLRIHQARVQELTTLRKLYLTKIGTLHHSVDSFGGQDQEVVCSLQEGVTVVLRLSPDCPLVTGSVKLDQIVGIGGWEEHVIESLKMTVNSHMCRGPLEMMEILTGEIKRLQSDGMVLPKTPTLPQKGKMTFVESC